MEEEKRCSMCQEDKPLTEFKSGGYCIPCQSDYHRIWRTTQNREGYNQYMRNYFRKRREEDPHYRIMSALRTRLNSLMKWNSVSANSVKWNISETLSKCLGCNEMFFRSWLQYQFDDEMNWNNYGTYWHIDHVLPVSMFNHEDTEAVSICWNWRNLRPLEARENIKKSNSINFNLYEDQKLEADLFIKKSNSIDYDLYED